MSMGIQVAHGLSVTKETATTEDHDSAQNPLGALVILDDGRKYRYMKANEAVAIGQIVTPLLGIDDADVDAAASDNSLTGTGDFTAGEFDDGASFVHINGGSTGQGQNKRIKSNTANVLYLESAWGTALATTDDYIVYSPYEVELCDAANEKIVGVALGTVSANKYGWFQVGGLAFVLCAGDTDALVAHEGIVSSAAAGVAKGLTAGGTTADEAQKAVGMAMVASSAATSAGQLYPVYLTNIPGA